MNIEYALQHTISVKTLDGKITSAIRTARIGTVYVKGEIAEYTESVSVKNNKKITNIYITLKHIVEEGEVADPNGYRIKCAIFDKYVSRLSYRPRKSEEAQGKAVIVEGYVNFYEPNGTLSIVVSDMIFAGEGDQGARIAALKEALEREGVFIRDKRPIPKMPSKICVITSLSEDSKALSDLCKGFRVHNPLVKIVAIPAAVSGPMISTSVPEAIRKANETDVDFIVLTRGGGGEEDVVTRFSEEPVVRAVLGSRKPIVSAIGHHTDHPLCDDVADMRASVPNETAKDTVADVFTLLSEMEQTLETLREKARGIISRKSHIVTNVRSLIDSNGPAKHFDRRKSGLAAVYSQLNNSYISLLRGKEKAVLGIHAALESPSHKLQKKRTELTEIGAKLDKDFTAVLNGKKASLQAITGVIGTRNPKRRMDMYRSKLDEYPKTLAYKTGVLIENKKKILNEKAVVIESLNPLAVLIRGYSVAYKGDTVLKSVSQVSAGDTVRVKLHDGEFKAEVK